MRSVELRQERQAIWERAKQINDKAEAEGRDFDAEEQSNYDKALADMTSLDNRIRRAEELERTPALAPVDTRRIAAGKLELLLKPDTKIDDIRASDEYRTVQKRWMVWGEKGLDPEERALIARMTVQSSQELRAMGISTAAAGGTLVAPEFERSVEVASLAYGGMLQAGTELRTANGTDIPYPTSNDTGNVGEIVAEGGTVSTQDPATGAVILRSYMFSSKIMRVSYQLLQDSAFDIEDFLRSRGAERIGRAKNLYFTVGVGASQPTGITIAATLGATGASTTSYSWDDLISLEHSVDPSYRTGPKVGLMFNDNSLSLLKRVKDGAGNYIWQPSVSADVPDRIHGYRYYINQDMASIASGARTIVFGDLGKYLMRMVQGMQVLRLEELYAASLQVGFLMFTRADGALIDAGTNPVKYLTH